MHEVQRSARRPSRHIVAATLDEALAELSEAGGRGRAIAGGTDLLLEIERGGHEQVDTLVDLSRLPGLDRIESHGDSLRIGALVTHNQIVASEDVVADALPLAQACLEIGAPPLRNRATVAANLVTASPAGDTISALLALGASVTLVSARGERTMGLSEFILGFRRTALAPDELLVRIEVPRLGAARRALFVKLGGRRAQAISIVHLAVVLSFEGSEVTAARIALGSVAPTVFLVEGLDDIVVGSALDDATIRAAAELARTSARPIDDLRASASYRAQMVEVMTHRALVTLRDGREREVWPQEPMLLSGPGGCRRPSGRTLALDLAGDEEILALINGEEVRAGGAAGSTLLEWLRADAHRVSARSLRGAKEGCAEGECGACAVRLDGQVVLACLVPAAAAHEAEVETVEGLADGDGLHPLQQAFVDRGAVQCGFCTPGLLVAGAAVLEERPQRVGESRRGLSGNLCRCTGYSAILAAMDQAAR